MAAILALIMVFAFCGYGEAHLLLSLRGATFSWSAVLLHLGLAAASAGLAWATGAQVDRSFADATAAMMESPATTAARSPRGGRALGPLVLMLLPLLVYLASLALVVTVAAGLAAAWVIAQLDRMPLALPLAVLVVIGGSILATLALLYHLLFPGRADVGDGALVSDRHARLWALSRTVAAAVGTRPVDRITVAATPGIGVYEAGGFLTSLFGRGQRVLAIGLPSLHDLEEREFVAILAHEYGHFKQGDTRWATIAAYLDRALRAALAAMPGPGTEAGLTGWLVALSPGYWALRLYAEIFFRVTGSFSRWQEVMADLEAIRLAGGPVFRTALLKIGMNDQLYAEALARHYAPALLRGGAPARDPIELLALARAQTPKAILKKFETDLLDPANTAPYDTHPPTRLRLDYAAHAPAVDDGSTAPAVALFDAWDEITAYAMNRLDRTIAAGYD